MTVDVKKLQELIRAQGMTTRALSSLTGVSEPTLRQILRGHEPSYRTLFRLAATLKVDQFEYITGKHY